MKETLTKGSHHIGLTVSDLAGSATFFIDVLGWQEVRRDPDYPAVFVSDGTILVTLWQVEDKAHYRKFDRKNNVGLHHLALMVESEDTLGDIYEKLTKETNVTIEFPPELLRAGPAKHMICYEPSGIRIEFIWPGN
jgi:catechol 2,3-dioxygenase-like lactoylglutathione lyase family enzyme